LLASIELALNSSACLKCECLPIAKDAIKPLALSKDIAEVAMTTHFEDDLLAVRCCPRIGFLLWIVLGRELSFVLVWELGFFIRF
jgi:hypothetical protein